MNRSVLSLVLAAVIVPLVAVAAPEPATKPAMPPPATGPEGGRPPGQRAPSVEGAMKGIARAASALGATIGDTAKKDDNLRLVNDMQRNCASAKGLGIPASTLAHAKDDAAKAKMTAEYRKDLIKVLRRLIDLEEAIDADKIDDAKAIFAEIQKMRETSHESLGVHEH